MSVWRVLRGVGVVCLAGVAYSSASHNLRLQEEVDRYRRLEGAWREAVRAVHDVQDAARQAEKDFSHAREELVKSLDSSTRRERAAKAKIAELEAMVAVLEDELSHAKGQLQAERTQLPPEQTCQRVLELISLSSEGMSRGRLISRLSQPQRDKLDDVIAVLAARGQISVIDGQQGGRRYVRRRDKS